MKTSLTEALKYHFLKYKKMTPQDTVKLIYQSEFGGGHLIADENYARHRLGLELADTPHDEGIPTIEYIGGNACRINLASLPDGLSAKTLTSIFARSAEMFSGTDASFQSKLYEVYSLIDEKYTPFNRYDYSKYIENYFASGGGAVHHSIYYNSAYSPAYRVIHTAFAPFIDLFALIDKKLTEKEKIIIKIDGHCGSGKSTLAGLLSSVYGCEPIHTDDFYLPREKSRDNGENTDFDRLNRELDAIISGESSSYNVFDCSIQKIDRKISLPESPIILIEGSYSLHPKLQCEADISVFLTLPEKEQLARIEKRSPESVNAFRERWIPMEEAYFNSYGIKNKCDLIIDTSI